MTDAERYKKAQMFIIDHVHSFFKDKQGRLTPEVAFPTSEEWVGGQCTARIRIKFFGGASASILIDFRGGMVSCIGIDDAGDGLAAGHYREVADALIRHVTSRLPALLAVNGQAGDVLADLQAVVRVLAGHVENLDGQLQILRAEVAELKQRQADREIGPVGDFDMPGYDPVVSDWSHDEEDGGDDDAGDADRGVDGPS